MLLPVEVEFKRTRLPRATLALLFLNTGIYLLCVLQGFLSEGVSLEAVRVLPDAPLALWALSPAHLHFWSFLTAPWVHLGILHLAGNLLFLWVFGAAAEEALGSSVLWIVYLLGGLLSIFVQYIVAEFGLAPADIYYAGSSGAVIALILAFAVRCYRARVRLWLVLLEVSVPVTLALLAFLGWYILSPYLLSSPGVCASYWGHLGGAAVGLLLALALRLARSGAADYSMEDALRKLESGDLRAGLEELQSLERSSSTDSRIPLALAHAYLKVWDRENASPCYLRAIEVEIRAGRNGAALEIWKEALANGVSLPPPAALTLAGALASAGNPEAAAQLYQWVITQGEEAAVRVAQQRLGKLI